MAVEKVQDRDVFLSSLQDYKTRFEAMDPELEVTLRDPAMGVEGFIVVWNTKISAGGKMEFSGKGGTRVTPDVTIDEVKMLARTMALKNAAAGLPWGGSKAGMVADSKAEGFEQKYRRFAKLCQPFLHENGGVFGGFGFDIGARPEMPHWACDELDSLTCFTGKPLDMGGTDYDREGIAGFGVAVAGKAMVECQGEEMTGQRFAVQGLGAMGAAVLRYFMDDGGVVAAVGDPKYGGSWRFENGVSEELKEAFFSQDIETAKALLEKEGAQISDSPEDVLYEDVDVLFPCALHNVVRSDNVNRIRARMVCEGANQPLTEDAYLYLFEKGVPVVPDFIANPGGIIAAYVELTSEVTPEENAKTRAKVTEAKAFTTEKIAENVRYMTELTEEYEVMPVQAGTYMALSRIFGEDG